MQKIREGLDYLDLERAVVDEWTASRWYRWGLGSIGVSNSGGKNFWIPTLSGMVRNLAVRNNKDIVRNASVVGEYLKAYYESGGKRTATVYLDFVHALSNRKFLSVCHCDNEGTRDMVPVGVLGENPQICSQLFSSDSDHDAWSGTPDAEEDTEEKQSVNVPELHSDSGGYWQGNFMRLRYTDKGGTLEFEQLTHLHLPLEETYFVPVGFLFGVVDRLVALLKKGLYVRMIFRNGEEGVYHGQTHIESLDLAGVVTFGGYESGRVNVMNIRKIELLDEAPEPAGAS